MNGARALRRSGLRNRVVCGASAVELLLALPVLILLGLGIVQFGLVYQARHALDYALLQAARAGSVEHADADAIIGGLASGLAPWLHGARNPAELLVAEAAARTHVHSGLAEGWLTLTQRSPLVESFTDWAVPARDPMGDPIAGLVEIPNDNLDNRRTRMQPASGTAAMRDDEPVGAASGQTLADANLLRLEMVYGFRLVVPVVGRWLIATLSRWDGCDRPGAIGRLGLVLPGSVAARADPAAAHCPYYAARDAGSAGRIPLRLSATIRMMSPPRRSPLTAARSHGASNLASLGPGVYDDGGSFAGAGHDGSGRPVITPGWSAGEPGAQDGAASTTRPPVQIGTGSSPAASSRPGSSLLPKPLQPKPKPKPDTDSVKAHPGACAS